MQKGLINFMNQDDIDEEENSSLPNLDCTDGVKLLTKYALRKAKIKPGPLFSKSSPQKTDNGFKHLFDKKKNNATVATKKNVTTVANKQTAIQTHNEDAYMAPPLVPPIPTSPTTTTSSSTINKPTVQNHTKSKISVNLSKRVLLNEFSKNNENGYSGAGAACTGLNTDSDFEVNSFAMRLPLATSTPSARSSVINQKGYNFALPEPPKCNIISNVPANIVNIPSIGNKNNGGVCGGVGGGSGGNDDGNGGRPIEDGNCVAGGNITININVPPSPIKCSKPMVASQQSNIQQQIDTTPINHSIPPKTPITPSRASSFITSRHRQSIDLSNTPKSTKVQLLAALDFMCAEKSQREQDQLFSEFNKESNSKLLKEIPSELLTEKLSPPKLQSASFLKSKQIQNHPEDRILVEQQNTNSKIISKNNKPLPMNCHSIKPCHVNLIKYTTNQTNGLTTYQTMNTEQNWLMSEDEDNQDNENNRKLLLTRNNNKKIHVISKVLIPETMNAEQNALMSEDEDDENYRNSLLTKKNNKKIQIISNVRIPEIIVTKPIENIETNSNKITPKSNLNNFLKPPTPNNLSNNKKRNTIISSHTLNLQNDDLIIDNSPNTALSLQNFYHDISKRDKTVTKPDKLSLPFRSRKKSLKRSAAAIEFDNFLKEKKKSLKESAKKSRSRRQLYSYNDDLAQENSINSGNKSKETGNSSGTSNQLQSEVADKITSKENEMNNYSKTDDIDDDMSGQSNSKNLHSKSNKRSRKNNSISSNESELNKYFNEQNENNVANNVNNDSDDEISPNIIRKKIPRKEKKIISSEKDNVSAVSNVSNTKKHSSSSNLSSSTKSLSLKTVKKIKKRKKKLIKLKCKIDQYQPFRVDRIIDEGCRRSNRERKPVQPRIYMSQLLKLYNDVNENKNIKKIKQTKCNKAVAPIEISTQTTPQANENTSAKCLQKSPSRPPQSPSPPPQSPSPQPQSPSPPPQSPSPQPESPSQPPPSPSPQPQSPSPQPQSPSQPPPSPSPQPQSPSQPPPSPSPQPQSTSPQPQSPSSPTQSSPTQSSPPQSPPSKSPPSKSSPISSSQSLIQSTNSIKVVQFDNLTEINFINGIHYITGINKMVGLMRLETKIFKSNTKSVNGVELTVINGNVTITIDGSVNYGLNSAESITIPAGSFYSIQNGPDCSMIRYVLIK